MSGNKSSGARRRGRAASRAQVKERLAAARAAETRRQRRRWAITLAVVGVLVIVLAGGAFWALRGRHSANGSVASAGTGQPPWARPADTADRAKAAGLAVSSMEGTARHFHAHLDVIVDGKSTPVPAGLGIATSGEMAELHTHDATGVLHIEAPTKDKHYTLGQLFDEWNVRLTNTALGGLTSTDGRALTAYVNGKKTPGDPAAITLTAHREIALVYGPREAKVQVPSSYDFPAGE